MPRSIMLGASTIMGMFANPALFTKLPFLEPLKPTLLECQADLQQQATSGCSACQRKQQTLKVYARLVQAFVELFMHLYRSDGARLYPLLDYFHADSVELPVKEGPRIIVSRP